MENERVSVAATVAAVVSVEPAVFARENGVVSIKTQESLAQVDGACNSVVVQLAETTQNDPVGVLLPAFVLSLPAAVELIDKLLMATAVAGLPEAVLARNTLVLTRRMLSNLALD